MHLTTKDSNEDQQTNMETISASKRASLLSGWLSLSIGINIMLISVLLLNITTPVLCLKEPMVFIDEMNPIRMNDFENERVLPAGSVCKFIKSRYGKDRMYYRVELENGERGYIERHDEVVEQYNFYTFW